MRNQTLRLIQRLRAGAAAEAISALSVAGPSYSNASGLRMVRGISQLSSMSRQQEAIFAGFAVNQRGISTSTAHFAEPLTDVPVEGNVSAVLDEIDRVISNESVSAKEVADAAVSLAYLGAKGNRRLWGKVFEKASAVKGSFDAASLTNFLWAATTAGVGHYKTVFELSGAAAANLKSLTPTQLSIVVEALGKAGVKDAQLFGQISDQATANIGGFKGAELARLLWGFAAAGVDDVKLAKAVGQALAGKAGELGAREAVQAFWGMARLRRADKATLDALAKTAAGKLGSAESGVDAAALAWSMGFLGYKPDASTAKAVAAAIKGAAAELSPAHAIDAAWGLGLVGAGDRDTMSALFSVAASAIEKAPDSLDPYQVAALFEASAMTDAKLPDQVASFSRKMFALAEEHAKHKRSGALQCFKEDLAQSTARAMGARYRPEVAAALKQFANNVDGVGIDIAVDLDGTKVAVEAVGPHYLSSANTLLGPVVARSRVLESCGYKVVTVPFAEWAGLQDAKAKASYVLKAIRGVPGVSGKIDALQKNLDKPFDPYA